MTAPYEAEVRFRIPDIDAFRGRIQARGGTVVESYAFRDRCHRSRIGPWDWTAQSMRTRTHTVPAPRSEVLFSAVDVVAADGFAFKRSRLAAGKATLFTGTADACASFLDALGYTPWFDVIKTDCVMWNLPNGGMAIAEHVAGATVPNGPVGVTAASSLGWMSEIEVDGEDPRRAREAIAAKLAFLGVDVSDVTPAPLPVLVGRSLGLLPSEGAPRRAYFCGSIRGGRRLQPRYAAMIEWLQDAGYEVLTAHVGRPEVLDHERVTRLTDRAIYEGDMAWIARADLVVADVTVPSLGVGMELMRAADLGKPIVCLCEEETSLSALVAGNRHMTVHRYRDHQDALRALARAVAAWEASTSDATPRANAEGAP